MKLFLLILLNTFIAIAIIYALLVILDVSFVCSFSSIMKHHASDLTVILTNKRDNLIMLMELLNKSGVKLDKKKVDSLVNFDLRRIETHDGEEAKVAREELTSLNEYFLSICGQNDLNDEDGEIQRVLSNINELETVYRHHLMMYNADVLGYNFWISFYPTRYIYRILKFKPKENI